MLTFSRYAFVVMLGSLALAWPAVAASQSAPGITILSPQDLELTGDSVKTLTIRNDTSATVGLQFSAQPDGEPGTDGATSAGVTTPGDSKTTVLPSTATVLQAHAVGQFAVEISTEKQFDGYLCVGVNGAFRSGQGMGARIPLSIHTTPWWKQPTPVVLGAVLFGILFVLARWVIALLSRERGAWKPSGLMGGVEWDPSKSFGSAIGLFAGVSMALAEWGLLPDADTTSGSTLLGLSFIFAVLILLAPVVYTVCQKGIDAKPDDRGEEPDPPQRQPLTTTVTLQKEATCVAGTLASTRKDDSPEEEIVGYVLPFLVTSALTIGAVAGQFWTSYLMLEELHDNDALTIGIRLLEIALFSAGLLLGVHFWRTMNWIIRKQHREAQRLERISQVASGEPIADRPRWTPL